MQVRATETGYYGHQVRREGDVFTVAEGDKLGKWMEPIHPLDHDEDGRKGGSKPKAKAKPKVDPVASDADGIIAAAADNNDI